MYFTTLPDHTKPGFDERSHFSKFKKHNIIFNALSRYSNCDHHVGCLSFKTVLSGEEWYGIGNRSIAVRPGQFLMMNDDQPYSCRIDNGESARVLSVFFERDFASSVFRDVLGREEHLLDDPFKTGGNTPEFFQTLNDIDPDLQIQLHNLISALNGKGYDSWVVDEHLVFILSNLIRMHLSASKQVRNVNAVKPNTKTEIYKRLCMAKDMLQSFYMDKTDLNAISNIACLSIPQLVRQFKFVFHVTPHQYLMRIRLQRAAELLKLTDKPVYEITWRCGFEDFSAFCRAFKSEYGVQPGYFRKMC